MYSCRWGPFSHESISIRIINTLYNDFERCLYEEHGSRVWPSSPSHYKDEIWPNPKPSNCFRFYTTFFLHQGSYPGFCNKITTPIVVPEADSVGQAALGSFSLNGSVSI